MNLLISELIREHEVIASRLRSVYLLGASNPQARKELRSARDLLVTHLHRESLELHPPLLELAKRDPALRRLMDGLALESGTIAEALLTFFGNHDNSQYSAFQFARDFGVMSALITSRMRREEAHLFPVYLKLQPQRSA